MGKTTGRREWLSMVAQGAAASTGGVLGSARAGRSNDVGGDCRPRPGHIAVAPPSTNSSVPVTYEASSEARNRMQAATSSGVP